MRIMWLMQVFILSHLLLFGRTTELPVNEARSGHKLYSFKIRTESHLRYLRELALKRGIDALYLTTDFNETMVVTASKRWQQSFENYLTRSTISFSVLISDLSKYSANLTANAEASKKSSEEDLSDMEFNRIYSTADMRGFMSWLAKKYPRRAIVKELGYSMLNQKINLIHISKNFDSKVDKPVIFVDGGMHGREWASPAAAMYMIYMLLLHFQDNDGWLERHDWVILPVVNPDGYECSRTIDVFWKKTRSTIGDCIGADVNKNFNFHWGQKGAAKDSCSQSFDGKEAASEPETRLLMEAFDMFKKRIALYVSLHSYGRFILYPWAFSSNPVNNLVEYRRIAKAAANAIETETGTEFKTGAYSDIFSPIGGTATDYAVAVAKVQYAYHMKLAAGGITGVHPSETELEDIVKEAWIGMHGMIREMEKITAEKISQTIKSTNRAKLRGRGKELNGQNNLHPRLFLILLIWLSMSGDLVKSACLKIFN